MGARGHWRASFLHPCLPPSIPCDPWSKRVRGVTTSGRPAVLQKPTPLITFLSTLGYEVAVSTTGDLGCTRQPPVLRTATGRQLARRWSHRIWSQYRPSHCHCTLLGPICQSICVRLLPVLRRPGSQASQPASVTRMALHVCTMYVACHGPVAGKVCRAIDRSGPPRRIHTAFGIPCGTCGTYSGLARPEALSFQLSTRAA